MKLLTLPFSLIVYYFLFASFSLVRGDGSATMDADSPVDLLPVENVKKVVDFLFSLADVDKSGSICVPEFRRWFQTIGSRSLSRVVDEEFVRMDKNKDKFVNSEELFQYRKLIYNVIPADEKETENLFAINDANKDGLLSINETYNIILDEQRTNYESHEAAEAYMERFGNNKVMNLEQFKKFVEDIQKTDRIFLAWHNSSTKAFNSADADKDGVLIRKELADLLLEDINKLYPPIKKDINQITEVSIFTLKEDFDPLVTKGCLSKSDIHKDVVKFAKSSFTHLGDVLSSESYLKWIVSLFDEQAVDEVDGMILVQS